MHIIYDQFTSFMLLKVDHVWCRTRRQPDRWWLCQCFILSSEQTGSTATQVMTMSVFYPLFWTDWQYSLTGDDYVSVLSSLLNRLAVQRHRWWLCQCVILSSEQTGSTATQVMTVSVCYLFWTDWQYSDTGDDYVSVLSSLLNRLAVQRHRWWLCQCFVLSSEQTGSTATQVMTMSVCYPFFWTDWQYSDTGDDYVSVLSCLLNRLAVQRHRWWLCQCVILSSEQTGSTATQVMTMSVFYPLFWTDWQYSLTGDDYVSVLSSLLNRLAVQRHRWWLCQCVILSSEQTGSTAWQVMTMSVCYLYPLFWTDWQYSLTGDDYVSVLSLSSLLDWQYSLTGDDYVSVLSCLLNRLAVQRHRWWLCQCVILSFEQTGSTAWQVMTMSVCYPLFWTDWQYSLTGDDYVSVLSSLLNRLAVQPDRWWLCQCVILSSE